MGLGLFPPTRRRILLLFFHRTTRLRRSNTETKRHNCIEGSLKIAINYDKSTN